MKKPRPDITEPKGGAGSRIPRRRFMMVLAAGGAAIAAGSLPLARAPHADAAEAAQAPAAKPRRAPAGTTLPPEIVQEIENQKKSLGETLAVVRGYALPAGSEPAAVFRAMRARREGR
jgi:hypothetical protein